MGGGAGGMGQGGQAGAQGEPVSTASLYIPLPSCRVVSPSFWVRVAELSSTGS